MKIMFILERQANKSGGDRYFAALESGENWTVYFPQSISRNGDASPKKALEFGVGEGDTIFQLERPAKKTGGDRYTTKIEGEDWVVYFPQELSRSEGEPKKTIQARIGDMSTPKTKTKTKKKNKATELVA